MKHQVFVGNLNYQTTEEGLTEHFAPIGKVLRASIPKDRETGQPRGFGFVEFGSGDEVSEAVRQLHGLDLDGRQLNVREAEERGSRHNARDGFDGGTQAARRPRG